METVFQQRQAAGHHEQGLLHYYRIMQGIQRIIAATMSLTSGQD
jgi:hypothetical protein